MKTKIILWILKFLMNYLDNYINKNNNGRLDEQDFEILSQNIDYLSRLFKKFTKSIKNV